MGGMHELSLLRGVVDAVTDAAGSRPISAVGMSVGDRSGVVIEALEQAWPLAIAGTACEGARLDIERVQATVYCPNCEGEQPIDDYFALLCPVCGTPTADLRKGKEFTVSWVDVESP